MKTLARSIGIITLNLALTDAAMSADEYYKEPKDCVERLRCYEYGVEEDCHVHLDVWTKDGRFISKRYPRSVKSCPSGLRVDPNYKHDFISFFPTFGGKSRRAVALESIQHIVGKKIKPTCEEFPRVLRPVLTCTRHELHHPHGFKQAEEKGKRVLYRGERVARHFKEEAKRRAESFHLIKLIKLNRRELRRAGWLP